jgi:ubiquinol-cytochrome c reductase cytochrome b subunit
MQHIFTKKYENSFWGYFLADHLSTYLAPINLNHFWGFGSLSGLCLALQIVSGLFLATHYINSIDGAFISVEHIMRDVNGGWFARYAHANGASFFFILVYAHLARSLYYKSYFYPRRSAWLIGVLIFLLLMATAFMGYVLPWGQMSFWGATVITSLFSAIPVFGAKLTAWLWGGFSVNQPTLGRLFVAHFLLPFVILGLVVLHLAVLHKSGSSQPLSFAAYDKVTFYPYFFVKDFLGFLFFLFFLSFFIFYKPNYLGHPDNYIVANILVTPPHIVPEWYFLPFYAILRSVPDKLGGVLLMFSAIALLALLPYPDSQKFSLHNAYIIECSFLSKIHFWFLVVVFVLLAWCGALPAEHPFVQTGEFCVFCYFLLLDLTNRVNFIR